MARARSISPLAGARVAHAFRRIRDVGPPMPSGLVLLSVFLAGCQATAPISTRAPARELPKAAVPTSVADGTESAGGGGQTEDDEPDLLPAAEASTPADDTPGEGLPPPPSLEQGNLPAASRYARLDRASCESELTRRHISFNRVGEARGVIAPLRLTGPLSGITFRSNLPESKSRTSPYDIYDCRLVLALDDFAQVLAKHDIVEVVHLSVYRPVSSKVALKGAGRRHGGALAIDAALFKTKDGRTLSVEKDFHGRIGARPCPAPQSASELRKIACEASDARLFNVLLTPDFNWAHRNHFHLEVTAGVGWTLVR